MEETARLCPAQPPRERQDVERDSARIGGRVWECHHTVLRAAHHEPERKNCAELVLRRPEPRRHRRLLRLLFVALIVASGGREHLRESSSSRTQA